MRERRKAKESTAGGSPRWWRISEHEWYKVGMAALTLAATAFGVLFAVQQVLPESDEPQPVKNNYAILLDHSESMGAPFEGSTKLAHAVDEILRSVDTTDSRTTARGLWYFGGGCGAVDENVSLRPDNEAQVRAALADPPLTHGARPLVHALDAAVSGLADIPVTLGQGDVRTVRRIVVLTDGVDGCGGDLTRVTTSLEQSGIQVEFVFVGFDLTTSELGDLQAIARSLPGIGGERARVVNVSNEEELMEAMGAVISGGPLPPGTLDLPDGQQDADEGGPDNDAEERNGADANGQDGEDEGAPGNDSDTTGGSGNE